MVLQSDSSLWTGGEKETRSFCVLIPSFCRGIPPWNQNQKSIRSPDLGGKRDPKATAFAPAHFYGLHRVAVVLHVTSPIDEEEEEAVLSVCGLDRFPVPALSRVLC